MNKPDEETVREQTNKAREPEPEEHDWSVFDNDIEHPDWEPPDIEQTWYEGWSIVPCGIISDFFNIVKSDTPDTFKLLSIYNTISSMLGPYFAFGKFKLNLMSVISSPPGIGRRSTVMRYDEILRESCLIQFCRELGIVSSPNTKKGRNIYSYLNIMTGTPEGIADAIIYGMKEELYKCTDPHFFTISDSEFGQTLKQYGYQYGILTILSRLKYGEEFKFSHSKRGDKKENVERNIPNNTYVTLLGGMQNPELFIDYTQIYQGLFRRLIFAYVEPNDIDKWMPPLSYGQVWTEEQIKLKELGKEIGKIKYKYRGLFLKDFKKRNNQPIEISIANPECFRIINSTSRDSYEALKKSCDSASLSGQNDWEHVLILACLNALSRGDVVDKLVVRSVDVFLAKAFVNRLKINRDKFCRQVCVNPDRPDVSLNTLRAFIKEHGKVEISVILKTFNITAEFLMTALHTLLASKQIKLTSNIVEYVE